MPELPEVEVVRLSLEAYLTGKRIQKIEILNKKSFIGDPRLVEGQKIIKFSRIGKQLSIYLSNGYILLVHLKMTGQFIYGDALMGHPTKDAFKQLPNKSTRIIFYFSPPSSKRGIKGEILYFNDQRKFGWIKLLNQTELVEAQSNLGRDVFAKNFTPQYVFTQLQKSRRPVKVALLDQKYFAGIGNIYANDALFLAKILPTIPANKITQSQAKSIHHHLIDIMHQSVLAGGYTAKDNQYLHPDGSKGGSQFFYRVYDKKGEPCIKCGTKIKYLKLAGRGTFFCPHCQK